MLGRTHPPSNPARARLRRAVAALAAAGAFAAVAGPASAGAATIDYESIFENGQFAGQRLIYEAAPGENNLLVLSESVDSRGRLRLRFDDTVPITADRCDFRPVGSDQTVADCEAVKELTVRLKDGQNVLRSFSGSVPMLATADAASSNSFDGGPGTDKLFGGQERDILLGGSGDDAINGIGGNDSLAGGPGNDSLAGFPGNDTLNGNEGADTLIGQEGNDTVTYRDRSNPVKVTIDDLANDGETGEGDNVRSDVENVEGGNGNDELVDQAGRGNAFFGRDGSDKLIGGAGEDQTLVGGRGDDAIDGGAGNDMLFGSDGFDLLKGGTENDLLFGEAGSLDTLDGGPGADTLSGGDGFDIVSYQSATQRVTVDLDGQAGDDGATGEGDTVRGDLEQLMGGPASDTLTGNASDNLIIGGDGNDVIDGGLGTDNLQGGNDNDTLRAKDGIADRRIDCGADTDQVDADTFDTQTNCEGPAAPAVGIGPKRAPIDKHGRVKLTLHCWATAVKRCTGTLKLEHRAAGTIASRRFTVASGDTATVRMRLDRGARRTIAGKSKLRVRAITRSRDRAGHKWTSKRTMTLVR